MPEVFGNSEELTPAVGSELSDRLGVRTEPEIVLEEVNKLMPPGFEVIDPDSPLGRAQLGGLEIHGLGSMHLAASNRALWR